MIIEVDQSIKIERTNQDTTIGLATKDKEFSVLISRQIKRQIQTLFRRAGKPRLFVYRTFVAAVVLSIKHSGWKNITDVTIDIEYKGNERQLRSIFLEMWSRVEDEVPDISFREIGKRSRAHYACYSVTIGKKEPDKKLTIGELKRLSLK